MTLLVLLFYKDHRCILLEFYLQMFLLVDRGCIQTIAVTPLHVTG